MARGSESVGEGGTERDERSTEAHGSQPGESGSRAAEYSLSQTLSSSLKCLLFTRSLPLNPCQHHFHPFLMYVHLFLPFFFQIPNSHTCLGLFVVYCFIILFLCSEVEMQGD
ncbi:hypothetical protein S83_009017 [Arachis hypogaea]